MTAAAAGARTARRLRLAAALIAASGLAVAAWAWLQPAAAGADGGVELVGGAAYTLDPSHAQRARTERLGGHALVATARVGHWIDSLGHGRRLAWTAAAVSAAAAFGCLWLAGLADEDDAQPPGG